MNVMVLVVAFKFEKDHISYDVLRTLYKNHMHNITQS